MAAAIPYIAAGATAISEQEKGAQEKKAAEFEARQLEAKSRASTAKGLRDAMEERRQGKVFASNVRAAMAASGADTMDVGAIEALANIKQTTDYNSLVALFEAETESDTLKLAGRTRRWEGTQAKKAGFRKSAATVMSSYSSLGGGSSFGGG